MESEGEDGMGFRYMPVMSMCIVEMTGFFGKIISTLE